MARDLSTDLSVLQSHMDGMIDRVQQNDLALKRFQAFEMRLLNLDSLSEMFRNIFDDAKALFDLDAISICLIDENKEIRQYLSGDGFYESNVSELSFLENEDIIKSAFGFALRPYVGPYKATKCRIFFPNVKEKLGSVAIIPLTRRGRKLGTLGLGCFNPGRYEKNMATDFVEHMAMVISVCLENNLNFEVLKRTGLIDTLTGINNRRFLEQRLREEVYGCQRNNTPLTCLFLDVDFFKKINDEYGHQGGDLVLNKIAGEIKTHLRNNDVLARYGGEEFVALLSNIDEDKGVEIAERIREKIKSLKIQYQQHIIQVSISIGLASYLPDRSDIVATEKVSENLIHAADDALYKAKNTGRDRVVSNGLISDFSSSADMR